MELIIILLIALSLAIDCFAVGICLGGSKSIKTLNYFSVPIHFGIFHIGMLLIGYFIGYGFKQLIEGFDHWIAFVLLLFVGIKMIRESLKKNKRKTSKLSEKEIIMLSIATSIDALAIGITLSMMNQGVLYEALIIGGVALLLGLIGLIIGKFARKQLNTKYIGILGGIVLIGIGVKILLEHML